MKAAIVLLVSSVSSLPVQAASEAVVIPSASDVVAHLMQRDAERQAALSGYTATRRYTLDNKSRHASMVVHLAVDPNGYKRLAIVHEPRRSTGRKHVFPKVREEEA